MESGNQNQFHLGKPRDNHGVNIEQKQEFEQIKFCQLLGQQAVPHFGIYGYEYNWIYPTAIFRREFNSSKDFNDLRQTFPKHIKDLIAEGIEQNLIASYDQIHYYVMNLNARSMKLGYLIDKNQSRIRLNFAPHAYLWPQARFGQELKTNVISSIFTSENKKFLHSSIRGIDECNDFGRITINTSRFFSKSNFQEVHLHQADEENTAVSPNNGAFLLNLTMPVVNFYLVMCTTNSNDHQLSIFNVTIVNDETMKLTRELDTCLNIQKILTYTPNRSDINQQNKRQKLIPSMYLKVLDHTTKRVVKLIENHFSFYLEKFSAAMDKEALLRELFVKLFAEVEPGHSVEPYVQTIGEEYLKLFYKYVWFKFKSPEVENFGARLFKELESTDYQIYLVRQFMICLTSSQTELYNTHNQALAKFVPQIPDDEHMEDLAIIESHFLSSQQFEGQSASKRQRIEVQQEEEKVTPSQKSNIERPKIKINDEEIYDDPLQSDYLDQFPAQVPFPGSQSLQNHLEALFNGQRQEIVASFNALKPVIQDYICFEIWKQKGSVHGIHNDFGRHSYLQTNEIGDYYHTNDEDRVNFILQLQELFNSI